MRRGTFFALAALVAFNALTLAPAARAQKAPTKAKAPTVTGKAAAIAVVNQFEAAYARRDKKTMLLKLMVPVPGTDRLTLQKRGEWYAGHGPGDAPGTAPALFASARGSFVPTKYAITQVKPGEGGRFDVMVREEGTYRDEDGRYKVSRVRLVKTTTYKGKAYIMDYVLPSNQENYGFYVDDVSDTMTKL